jgi:hypothetical protein
MKNVLDKSCGEKIKIHILFSVIFFENRTVCEIMSKNTVETEGTQMTSQNNAYALHAGLARLFVVCTYAHAQAHAPVYPPQACTHRPICNTYCFSSARVVM